jgi:DNA modification methylase
MNRPTKTAQTNEIRPRSQTEPEPRRNGYAIARNLNPNLVRIDALKPLGRETRKHPPAQIRKLQASIEQFGFVLPIVIDAASRVIAGWALALAAKNLGVSEVPAVTITDLDEANLRMLRLALNRLSEDARWDIDGLRLEFSDIMNISGELDLRVAGFEMGEIDVALEGSGGDEEDDLPALNEASIPVTQAGDLWLLGEHRILCADAAKAESYARLLGDERAQMIFTDPPWNIPIAGHVSGLGSTKHGDFAMGCGELSAVEFEDFLRTTLGHAARCSHDGSIHFVCMHWGKIRELLAAAADLFAETKNLCVWNKSNAGMGSLYRSKHELVFVFKKGDAPHVNNIELGRFGRHRTNVWDYPSQNALNRTTKSKLSLHPTAKPVALVADAIRDCSNRNDIILDPFAGAGTTLIAAEKTGRRARLIDIDPRYVDVTIKRWRNLTGRTAVRAAAATPHPDNAPQPVPDAALTMAAPKQANDGAGS